MDTKLKSSRKAGVIAAVLLLAFCSLMMLSSYPGIPVSRETQETTETTPVDMLDGLGEALMQGNFILYNEYSKQTPLSDVLDIYGQTAFELARRYLDYEVFDTEGNALLNNEDEGVQENLTGEEQDHYAFRVKYTFSDNGELSEIRVDGSELSAKEAYDLESGYISRQEIAGEYEISSISTPQDVTIIYGMTSVNLNAYYKDNVTEESYDEEYDDIYYAMAEFDTTLEPLIWLVIIAALVLPFFKKFDISGMKIFAVPFEIPAAVLLIGLDFIWGPPMYIAYHTVNGTLLPGLGRFEALQAVVVIFNFIMWMALFGITFWAFTCLRAIFRMKGAYWKKRTLTARLIRHIRKQDGEEDDDDAIEVKRLWERIRDFFARQYDALLHLDFRNKTKRTILQVVLVNFAILVIICCFWFFGLFALIIYSVLLFLFLHKYTEDLREKYKLLLESTNQLAEGHLDAPIEGDIGLFNPIQDELKKIQKGFKKAVDEEVKNERMKTELVTNVSHDLRTPLTAIITYTDLLKNEKDEEKRREYIEVLEKKSLRLKVLIEDLFEISKAASKSVVMHYMKVDIVDLLKQVGLENDGKIKDANLEFRWKLPEQKVVMCLDSQKTYRIFENLIVNITKYAMPHTRVYIEMTELENAVRISMKNISATELDFDVDEITDRFVRGDSSRNTEGSGLGLAIAKSFTELQHGTLTISTEADLFKADITLPKLEMPEEAGA